MIEEIILFLSVIIITLITNCWTGAMNPGIIYIFIFNLKYRIYKGTINFQTFKL